MSIIVISLLLLGVFTNVNGTNNWTNEEIGENRNKRQETNGWEFVECILPPHPDNGQWKVISGTGIPGTAILPNTLIRFFCNPGFELEPKAEFFICNPEWDPSKMPSCIEKLCPPLKSTSVKFIKCFNGKGNPIECSKVPNGGTATIKCAPYYELSKEEHSTIQCLNEKWSRTPPECNISCGQAVKERDILVTYDKKNFPKYPWIANLFRKEDERIRLICGGSLISTSHVLTAAHCVSGHDGLPTESDIYQISAGKTYQAYGDPRDLMAQYVDVANLIVHPKFRGQVSNYEADIAILKTRSPFRLSPLVQPICINGLLKTNPTDDDRGVVGIWGVTPDEELTEEVKYFESNITRKKCVRKLPLEFITRFVTADKLCVHFEERLDTICKGYSGAAFGVEKADSRRFFIQGIISVSPYNTSTRCSEPTNLCTKTVYYYDFIIDNMNKL